MLQSMAFRNVGLFKSTNVIKFSNDEWTGCLGVLVGMNASGKTMATECIRRCLHSDMSHSDSTIPDPTTPSYILCKYELDPKMLRNLTELAEDETIFNFSKNICDSMKTTGITGIFVKNNVKSKFLELSVVESNASLLLVRTLNGETVHYHNTYQKNAGCIQDVLNSIIQNEDERNDQNTAEYDGKDENMNCLENYLKLEATTTENDFNMIFEQLFGLLYGSVSFVYPMRGIGAAMGSESEEMNLNQSENYQNAVKSSKMMTKYWKIMKDNKEIENHYNHIINTLIPICRYELALEEKDDKEVLTLEDLDNPVTGRVPILKAPEGILEAILFSLCLATRKESYMTLCYDEPSRCMHRQLVDNMASYITELVKKKKVCLVLPTYSPCFISEETWNNITYFQRISVQDSQRRSVQDSQRRSVQESQRTSSVLKCQTLHNEKFSISQLRFFSQEHIRTLVFAKKILWVEGETDQMFVQKLLAYLKCGTNLSKFSAEDKNQINKNSVQFGSIKVMYVYGKSNMGKMGQLCGSLNISYRILYDRDQVDNVKDMMTGLEHCLSPDARSKVSNIASNYEVRKWFKNASCAMETFINSFRTKEDSQFVYSSGNIDGLKKKLNKITAPIQQKMNDLKREDIQEDEEKIFNDCLKFINKFPSMNLQALSRENVNDLKQFHASISLSWAGTKQENNREFYWTSNALEEVVSKCAKDADKPLLERPIPVKQPDQPQYTQLIWYLDKKNENPGHMKTFTCEEMNKLTEFVLDNATDEIKAFVMFLTKFAEE